MAKYQLVFEDSDAQLMLFYIEAASPRTALLKFAEYKGLVALAGQTPNPSQEALREILECPELSLDTLCRTLNKEFGYACEEIVSLSLFDEKAMMYCYNAADPYFRFHVIK